MTTLRKTPALSNNGGLKVNDDTYAEEVNANVVSLWSRNSCWLNTVAGSNNITASADVPLTGSPTRPQFFLLAPAANNTSAVTLNIDSTGALAVTDINGAALGSSALQTPTVYLLIYDGVKYRCLNPTTPVASATGLIDWINITAAPYGASTTATDNSAAIQGAINAAVTAGVPIYVPSGVFKYATTLTCTAAQLVPIVGDSKVASVLVYTGAGEAIRYTPAAVTPNPRVSINTAYSNGDGHYFRNLAVEPSVAGGGTYGIRIVTTAAGTYRHFKWESVRVGQFGTASTFLDNSANATDCIAIGQHTDCDYINSIVGTLVGDTVKFANCRIDGTATMSFTQAAGAGDLDFKDCNVTTTGGMLFTNCGPNLSISDTETEVFVASGYTGANAAYLKFDTCFSVNLFYNSLGLIDLGTKPADTLLFHNCTSTVRFGGNVIYLGATRHVHDDNTNALIIDEGDNDFQGTEVTLRGVGDKYFKIVHDKGTGVLDANYTILNTDRVIYLGTGTLTANRTWTLPLLSQCNDGQRFVLADFAGGLGGTFSINVVRSGADVFEGGGTSITLRTQGARQELIASVGAAVWSIGRLVPQGGGIDSSDLVGYNTNTATASTTLTAANITGGQADVTLAMTGTLAAGANAQLPTVANLFAATLPGNGQQSYTLRIINESSANFAWTVTTNTGWTLSGTMTIAQNTWRDFAVMFTSTSAVTLQNIGTGTFS